VLRRARLRLLARTLLWAALASVVLNEALARGAAALSRLAGLHLAVPYIAPLLVAVLSVRSLRRLRAPAVAAEVDRRAGLKDRLATAVDLAGRADCDPEFREAQLRDAAASAAAVSLPRVVPVPAPLYAAALLFLAHFWINVVNPFLPTTPLRFVPRGAPGRRPAGEGVRAGAERAVEAPQVRPPGETAGQPPQGPPPESGVTVTHRPGQHVPPATQDAPPDAQPMQSPLPNIRSKPPRGAEPAGAETAQEASDAAEPMQLYSETVGAKLTPVSGTPLQGAAPQAPLPAAPGSGRMSFNLLPGGTGGGQGGGGGAAGGGGGTAPLRIVVDFERVPAAYRGLVRRYFEALEKAREGGQRGS
jgi:hypothetical protein